MFSFCMEEEQIQIAPIKLLFYIHNGYIKNKSICKLPFLFCAKDIFELVMFSITFAKYQQNLIHYFSV